MKKRHTGEPILRLFFFANPPQLTNLTCNTHYNCTQFVKNINIREICFTAILETSVRAEICRRAKGLFSIPTHFICSPSRSGQTLLQWLCFVPFERNSFIQGYISWALFSVEASCFGELAASSSKLSQEFSLHEFGGDGTSGCSAVSFLPWQQRVFAFGMTCLQLCFLNGGLKKDEYVFDRRQYKVDQFFDLWMKINADRWQDSIGRVALFVPRTNKQRKKDVLFLRTWFAESQSDRSQLPLDFTYDM